MEPPTYVFREGLLDIYSRPTIDSIEECLALLSRETVARLRCAHNMGFLPPFATARLIQFIQTWVQVNSSATFSAHCTVDTADAQLRSFASNPHGVAVLSLADQIVSLNGIDLSEKALIALEEQLRKVEGEFSASGMQPEFDLGGGSTLPVRGKALFLTAQDSPKKRLSKWLYQRSGAGSIPRGGSEFDLMVGRIVRDAGRAFLPSSIRTGLGTIFSEVFENTDNWGRTDLAGKALSKSLRCVHVRLIEEFANQDTISMILRQPGYIGDYVERLFPVAENKKASFLELSVIDGGIGYASRLADKPLTEIIDISEEYNLLRSCLSHHGTSGSASRSFGLVKVCRAANALKALVVIRSGHLSLYRDFSKEAHRLSDECQSSERYFTSDDARLYDTTTQTSEFSRNPETRGVAFSLLIPIPG